MTVIVNNLNYTADAGPDGQLLVEQITGSFPIGTDHQAFALGVALFDTGSNEVSNVFGASIAASKTAGAADTMTGVALEVVAVDADVTDAAGVRSLVRSSNTGTITTGSALLAQSPSLANSGAITTAIGVQIQAQTQSGVGQAWGLYGAGASDPNALAGSLSVGSVSLPQATLDVTGAMRTVPVTVAALPAAPVDGMRAFVTDATHSTFAAAVAGSGTTHVPVYYDGGTSTWRIG